MAELASTTKTATTDLAAEITKLNKRMRVLEEHMERLENAQCIMAATKPVPKKIRYDPDDHNGWW